MLLQTNILSLDSTMTHLTASLSRIDEMEALLNRYGSESKRIGPINLENIEKCRLSDSNLVSSLIVFIYFFITDNNKTIRSLSH